MRSAAAPFDRSRRQICLSTSDRTQVDRGRRRDHRARRARARSDVEEHCPALAWSHTLWLPEPMGSHAGATAGPGGRTRDRSDGCDGCPAPDRCHVAVGGPKRRCRSVRGLHARQQQVMGLCFLRPHRHHTIILFPSELPPVSPE
eukprot:scaffold155745_cov32-Tisochrysis_lutea.AAC.1